MANPQIEGLRDQINLPALIGRTVKLERRGRNHVGLCPFHQEKSPSFSVNEDKGFYHCFGCGAHGDAFSFVMETQGLGFVEAVELLAAEQGVPSPIQRRPERGREAGTGGVSLFDVMAAAVAFYQAQLAGPAGSDARRYLDGRGLGQALRDRFRLGFAPEGGAQLKDHLTQLGIPIDTMVEAGLLVTPEEPGRPPYERFRGRLMFPILDGRGRPIAFGGRTLKPDGVPKYLNSPETSIFHKGAVLFHWAAAREAVRKGATLLIAEGYVDVIALAAAGFGGAVAPLGTALTEEQLELAWRLAPEPVLCFDGDKAGLKAAERAVERALPLLQPGRSLRFAILPTGQDPDDVVRAPGGRDTMAWLIDGAKPLVDQLFAKELAIAEPNTPERIAGLRSRLMDAVSVIGHADLRRDYQRALFDRLAGLTRGQGRSGPGRDFPPRMSAPFGRPRGAFGADPLPPDRAGRAPWTPRPSAAVKASLAATAPAGAAQRLCERLEQALLLALVNHPALITVQEGVLTALPLEPGPLDKLRAELLHAAAVISPLDRQGLRDHLTACGLDGIITRMERQKVLKAMPFVWPNATAETLSRDWFHAAERLQALTVLAEDYAAASAQLAVDDTGGAAERVRALDEELRRIQGYDVGPSDTA